MNNRLELRFSGSGGQGVILASIIMAEAAVLAGFNTAQSQAYGPEARGGASKAETIISHNPIWYTKVSKPDLLLALTQRSLEAYSGALAPGGVVVADSSLTIPEGITSAQVIRIPILRTANEVVGKALTANIVSLGAINRLLGLFDDETMMAAIKLHIPAGTEELNERAYLAGAELINSAESHRAQAANGFAAQVTA